MAENLIVKIIGDASKLTSELEKASGNVKSFSEKVGNIGKVMTIVGGAVTAALGVIIKKTVDAGDAFNDMSLRTGIAVETLSALDYAGKQTGTAIEAIELSLKFLTKTMDDTSKGTGTAKDTFAALGITVVDTEGKLRPVVDVMKDIADKVAAIDDPAKQAAIAMELFGARSGTQLVPLLKLGGAGIDDLMAKAQELGIVMSTESAQAADEFKDRMYDLKESLGAVGRDIANVLIPPLLDFTNKAIEIVKRIREWADAHKPLIEAIILIGAKLAVFTAVGGPILMAVSALAKLKTAFTVLGMVGSGPIGIFIVAVAAITVGIIALNEHLKTSVDYMSDFRVKLNKMKEIADVEALILELTDSLDKLRMGLSELEPGEEYDDLLKYFETLKIRLEAVYKKREELTKAEKEGIETTKIAIPLTKEQSDAIDKLAEANQTLGDDIYKLTHTEYEYFIKKLYEQAQALIEVGVSMEMVDKWVELQTEAYIKLNPQIEKMGSVIAKVSSILTTKMGSALANISSGLFVMGGAIANVSSAIEVKMGSAIANISSILVDFSKTTREVFNTLITDFTTNFVKPFISKLVDELTPAVENFFFGIEGYKANWGTFWSGLWNTLKTYISNMVSKLIIAIPIMLVWNFLTGGITSWASLLKIWNWLGFEKGGGVKKYDFGGGIDTVPAMLTPGEYIISKPMVDAIKRFKAIPANLIGAISGGFQTPIPAFAGGGSVGDFSGGRIGYGDTNITVNITGNKISDEIDIKHLANTVSSEILRRINLNRRH